MKNGYWKEWIKAAGLRALRTFAQGMISYGIIDGMKLSEVDWLAAASAGAVAAILSILMSLAGLPEISKEPETFEDN